LKWSFWLALPVAALLATATGALLALHAVVTAVVLAAGRRSRR
jgi:hypothetical protein